METNFQNLTSKIDISILEFAKQTTENEGFRFDNTSNQKIEDKENKLLEIGYYVFAGILLACRDGLYDNRREILDYLINQKLIEYNDGRFDELLKDYNIRFQITDFMVEAIHEWRREMVK